MRVTGSRKEIHKDGKAHTQSAISQHAKAFDCVNHHKLWKILKEMRIPDHLTCLLRNLYAGQEATVRTGHGTTDWFQIGKGVCHLGMVATMTADPKCATQQVTQLFHIMS